MLRHRHRCFGVHEVLDGPNRFARAAQPLVAFDQMLESSDGNNIAANSVAGGSVLAADTPLTVADVVASLYRSYPEIARARQQTNLAGGQLTEAYGAFDTKIFGDSLSEPTGFYRNYRNRIGVLRRTWWGGYVSAGYRIGRGDFQPWYKERETEKGGEFKVGLALPLLQGRAIDPERLAVFQSSLAQRAAEPQIQQAILDSSREAATAYWDWVAAGATLEARRELLNLAEKRGEQYEVGFKAGKFAEVDVILNQQQIAERRANSLESERKFRATSFKLSLFLRDEQGQPLVPSDAWLPDRFPVVQFQPIDFQADLAAALSRRPEPRVLQLERRQVQLAQQVARNQLLPRIDVVADASQDVGDPATKLDDKGEFLLVLGLIGEMPIQRRKARGKIQSTNAKIAQINQKLRLQQDKIAIELQTAYNAMSLTSQVVQQADVSLRAAIETLDRYRFAFERGKIDLIYLNLLETKTNEAEIKLVDAQRNWFAAVASMQAALGLDPLDQAMVVAELPMSTLPGPGHLPEPKIPDAKILEQDWQKRVPPPDVP